MPSTMAYRQGDIVLVSFPFTDLSSSKRRPPQAIDGEGHQAVYDALLAHRQADRGPQHREDGGSPTVIAPFLRLRPDGLA